MSTNVVLTGGTGFLGKNLAYRLQSDGYSVHNFGRQQAILDPKIADQLVGEITALEPKYVIHLAAHQTSLHNGASIVAVLDSGLVLGSLMLEAALHSAATFVTIGSYWQHVRHQNNSVVFYAAAKDAFSQLTSFYQKEHRLTVRELTLFDTYGPGDNRDKLLPTLLQSAISRKKVVLREPDALINLTYITDVVEAIMLLVTTERQPSEAVARNESFTRIDELVQIVQTATGRTINHEYTGEAVPNKMTEPWIFGSPVSTWKPLVGLERGILNCWKMLVH